MSVEEVAVNVLNELTTPINRVMRRDTTKVPDQLRVFDLEIRGKSGKIEIEYTRAFQFKIEAKSWDDFEASLQHYLFGAGKPPKLKSVRRDKPVNSGLKRPKIDLSLAAPCATIENGETFDTDASRVFYVIRLKQKKVRKDRKWRYSTTFAPFSVSATETGKSGTKINPGDYFFNPCLIRKGKGPEGIEVEIAEEEERSTEDRYNITRIAGFCFAYDLVKHDDDVDAENFVLRFNIHVEIPSKIRRHSDPAKFHEWIPIIIDPDVGHPGGSYPPPPPGGDDGGGDGGG